jgi:hypothetical protein
MELNLVTGLNFTKLPLSLVDKMSHVLAVFLLRMRLSQVPAGTWDKLILNKFYRTTENAPIEKLRNQLIRMLP